MYRVKCAYGKGDSMYIELFFLKMNRVHTDPLWRKSGYVSESAILGQKSAIIHDEFSRLKLIFFFIKNFQIFQILINVMKFFGLVSQIKRLRKSANSGTKLAKE